MNLFVKHRFFDKTNYLFRTIIQYFANRCKLKLNRIDDSPGSQMQFCLLSIFVKLTEFPVRFKIIKMHLKADFGREIDSTNKWIEHELRNLARLQMFAAKMKNASNSTHFQGMTKLK